MWETHTHTHTHTEDAQVVTIFDVLYKIYNLFVIISKKNS